MVMAIAVAASLLAEIRFGVVRVPVIIWEIAFGILIGPHGLGLATAGASLEFLENSGLVALFFMAGTVYRILRANRDPLLPALCRMASVVITRRRSASHFFPLVC